MALRVATAASVPVNHSERRSTSYVECELEYSGWQDLAMPANDRLGLDDHEDGSSIRPTSSEPRPEDAITSPQPWPFRLSLQDRELLSEGKILGSELSLIMKETPNEYDHDPQLRHVPLPHEHPSKHSERA